jgi:hypothetical protein
MQVKTRLATCNSRIWIGPSHHSCHCWDRVTFLRSKLLSASFKFFSNIFPHHRHYYSVSPTILAQTALKNHEVYKTLHLILIKNNFIRFCLKFTLQFTLFNIKFIHAIDTALILSILSNHVNFLEA